MKNDEQLQQQALRIWLSLKIKFEGITVATACHLSAIRSRDYDNYQDDDARPEGENSAKRQKTSEYGTYSVGESSSGQAMDQDPNPSGSEDPNTRIEPRSDKESIEAEINADMVPVDSKEEDDELVGDKLELKRREKGKRIEETRVTLILLFY
ncbi:hypothetical protein Tco_1269405, partial [Tanacetum coccineum]